MLGKKSSVKGAKKRFLYSHEYRVQIKGTKKCAKQFFQKHTNSARKKCWGNNRRISAKKRFLYSHLYREQKMGTKKCTKQFFQKHTNSGS